MSASLFFWSDSHLEEGFFEISNHRHGVKINVLWPTRSKAYSAVVNQCLDIPLGMLHHSRPGRRRQIQFSTLYFLHFQVRHPGEEYGTPFLRRWAGRVQLSLLLTTPGSLHVALCNNNSFFFPRGGGWGEPQPVSVLDTLAKCEPT